MKDHTAEVFELITEAKRIARRYYELTGKPLGITGEIAEHEVARILGLRLALARQASVDAIALRSGTDVRVQIKGRAVDPARKYVGRVPKMKLEPAFDVAMLVLLDKTTYDPIEIWEADYAAIRDRLAAPGSKSRNERNSMGISQFKSISRRVWPAQPS